MTTRGWTDTMVARESARAEAIGELRAAIHEIEVLGHVTKETWIRCKIAAGKLNRRKS